jgi:cephalosporin-C deacetylase-like acetyl esterase
VVCNGCPNGKGKVSCWRQFLRLLILPVLSGTMAFAASAQGVPSREAFQVLPEHPAGPRITPLLRHQLDLAWRQDEARQRRWEGIHSESDLQKLQAAMRQELLQMIGGLPTEKTNSHPRIKGKIQMDGYSIERLIFESLPGVYVTALVYAPDDHSKKHPAVLVPAGHATNGKIHYQVLSQRLVDRGYVVIAWDPIGQGERSQFWDAKAGKSRYNLVCGEHAVLGNLAYLAGANLARWEVWDGIRAVDYLLTRPDVDGERISITGTSGGGTQAALIAALDPRIKVVIPSCYISSLPMRMANRIFADPDSDPEQDLYRMISKSVDHPGLLLLMYPRPVMVASAVLDFFPIEGARKTFREGQLLYERFGHAERIAMTEGYHGHEYSAENQEAALDFLDKFNQMPRRHGLADPKELPNRDLLCTDSGQVMLDMKDARSLTDVIREYYEERKARTGRSLATEYRSGQKNGVRAWTLAEYKETPPNDHQILWEARGSNKVSDIQVDKYVLHHSKELEIPLLFIHKEPQEKRGVLLWFGENGKAGPSDWQELEKHLQAGYDLVTFDFRGLGETRMPYIADSPDDPSLRKPDFDQAYVNPLSGVLANYVYNSLLTGRPYFLQMIEDAEIARRFVKGKLQRSVAAVTASGDNGSVANAIVEVFPGIKLVPQKNTSILKWADLVEGKQEVWPIQLLLPGGAYVH